MMKALVIDDSRTMRRIINKILTGLGFTVFEAGDGQEALAVMENEPGIDLCCIDWNMPVMDGLTFVKHVRAVDQWRSATLMMITTESEHGQIVRALAAGAHEYVIKPFTPEAIAQKLEFLGLLPLAEAEMLEEVQ